MRYTRKGTGDWVEFRPGVGQLPMAQVLAASNSPTALAEWVAKCEFVNGNGETVTFSDGASLMEVLTFQQWDWLTTQFVAWARDDVIDPEA